MAKIITVTGKGGVGKTTVAALALRLLVDHRKGAILAVDADPNLNFDAAIGVHAAETVGDVREETLERKDALPAGMTKQQYLELRTQQALVETKDFDFIAMGRPEGPGCYCYANSILRNVVDRLAGQYDFVLVDCEAGLEHISRRTTRNVDLMLLVSDLSVRSLETAIRVPDLMASLNTQAKDTRLILNRALDGLPEPVQRFLDAHGMTVSAIIPEDDEIRALDFEGKPLIGVSEGNPALEAVRGVLQAAGVL
jgi:CO dehydrogenase maturation factor